MCTDVISIYSAVNVNYYHALVSQWDFDMTKNNKSRETFRAVHVQGYVLLI
jgi:hypothetical protein